MTLSADELLRAFVSDVLALAIGQATRALARGVPQERAIPGGAATQRRKRKRAATGKPAALATQRAERATWHPTRNLRSCGCSPRGRHKRECAMDSKAPPPTVERSPAVERKGSADSPRIAIPVDETRAQRFARIEAQAKAQPEHTFGPGAPHADR